MQLSFRFVLSIPQVFEQSLHLLCLFLQNCRNSLVLLDVGGKVVGFQTYLLMPGGGGRTLAVQQALRIDPRYIYQTINRFPNEN